MYAELHCKSNFSFLEGASFPDELVARAKELRLAALGIADRNSLCGVVRAHVAAKDCGVKLLIGAEISTHDSPPIVLYPQNREAYGRLARLITLGRRRAEKGECILSAADVAEYAKGSQGILIPPADFGRRLFDNGLDAAAAVRELSAHTATFREAFGERLSLAAEFHFAANDAAKFARLDDISRAANVPLVAANDVHFHAAQRRYLQDALVCIREGCTIHAAGSRLFPNGERRLKSADEMRVMLDDVIFAATGREETTRTETLLARSIEIANACVFSLDELRYEYPQELAPVGKSQLEWLSELTWLGAKKRWPEGVSAKVRAQIEHELALIAELKYEAYFLTVWDLVEFARGRNILCQGRGSAANSAVCFCLGVTSVDPARTDVLFERFVSRERAEAPDIDVDFEHERREEVMQYVYEKYGRERAGLVAEVISYRPKSAVRDLGKALGMSLDRVDLLASMVDAYGDWSHISGRIREAGLDPSEPTLRRMLALCKELLGFPRHLSQHVGGFVITGGPLCELVPIENAAMQDRTVIEWDKDDIDALGILKVDCLALGMLTALHRCLDFVNNHPTPNPSPFHGEGDRVGRSGEATGETENTSLPGMNATKNASSFETEATGTYSVEAHASQIPSPLVGEGRRERSERGVRDGRPEITLATIPAEDPAVYEMCSRADTIGVFQIESRAQMSMLPRLRPKCFYDLVIEVSIVRPGPIQGGMVHPYLRRRAGEEAVTFPNEAIRAVLEKTLGVPLFQEQVMRLAMVAAGFSPGEADQLRRAMGAWRRPGLIERLREKLLTGMVKNNLPRDYAERIFDQIRGFGEYGFPESHAASFALLVYASAWLKLYHPAAFTASLLNSQPMGFYAPAQLVRDAQNHGVSVLPADVNFSDWDCSLENERTIRLGLRMIRGLSLKHHAEKILAARNSDRAKGERRFSSVLDFARRTGLTKAVLARLAAADAFSSLGGERREALWEVLAQHEELPLFSGIEIDEAAPQLDATPLQEHVSQDYETVGLSLKSHPMAFMREHLDAARVTPCGKLSELKDGAFVRVAGLVLVRQRPETARGVIFMTLEDETGQANIIVWPKVFEQNRKVGALSSAVIVEGNLQRQKEIIHVVAKRFRDLAESLPGLDLKSRDFR